MSTAPGQLLGYQLQLQRALVHLLQSGQGSSVSVEVTGDVAVALKGKGKIEEEDKSSVKGNPVTDRSIDLWKTFYNWIEGVNEGTLGIVRTKFILYANHEGKKGIVNALCQAHSAEEIEHCLNLASTLLGEIEDSHPIYPYLLHVLNHRDVFSSIIRNFDFIIGSKTGSKEIEEILSGIILVSKHHLDFVHDELVGWITNIVMARIAAGQPAIITWEEYQKRFLLSFERVRARELIDFTKEYTAEHIEVKEQIMTYPRYLRQLQIIEIDDQEQVSAVSDFLRARINADKWIESEIIDDVSAKEFEESLKSYWKSTFRRLSITEKLCRPEERGQLLYYDCKERQATISGRHVQSHFVRGTYHNLTNENYIGWHESWELLLHGDS